MADSSPCLKCSAPLVEGWDFCASCGAPVAHDAPAEAATEDAPDGAESAPVSTSGADGTPPHIPGSYIPPAPDAEVPRRTLWPSRPATGARGSGPSIGASVGAIPVSSIRPGVPAQAAGPAPDEATAGSADATDAATAASATDAATDPAATAEEPEVALPESPFPDSFAAPLVPATPATPTTLATLATPAPAARTPYGQSAATGSRPPGARPIELAPIPPSLRPAPPIPSGAAGAPAPAAATEKPARKETPQELVAFGLVAAGAVAGIASLFLPWANDSGIGIGNYATSTPPPNQWGWGMPASLPLLLLSGLVLGAITGKDRAQERLPKLASYVGRVTDLVLPLILGGLYLGIFVLYVTLPSGYGAGLTVLLGGAALMIAGALVALFAPPATPTNSD